MPTDRDAATTRRRPSGVMLAAAGVAAAALGARAAWRARTAWDLRGRTVLVTGGSRGLGLLLAREFGRHGARVAICARDESTLARARADLAAREIESLALACDVGDRDAVALLVDAVEERFGPVDVLVNNAGEIQMGPVETMTVADFEREMATHFWGPLHTTLAVLPSMRRRRAGRIVNIASIGGKVPVPHLLPYSASKFALVGLSEGLHAELAAHGITVTTICPGLMRTGSPRHARFKGKHRAEYAWFTLADSLPGPSMSAERAARRIVEACRHGEAEVVLGLPARILASVHGVLPGTTTRALAAVDRLLPDGGGIGTASRAGHESESPVTRSPLTALTARAGERTNQRIGAPR